MTRMTRPFAALLGTVVLAVLPACGGSEATGGGEGPLAGASFVVGAKDFAEQNVLAELTAHVLRANGAAAEAKEIKGSINTRKALEAGEVDLYWEYTGTAWVTYLGETTPLPDPQQQYDAVAQADRERNGIAWLPAADFNNTYALAVPPRSACAPSPTWPASPRSARPTPPCAWRASSPPARTGCPGSCARTGSPCPRRTSSCSTPG
jgi:osmoprotectant transport system substrate-binding protein